MIHTVKVFSVEVDVFLNSLAFSMIQLVLAIWSLVPLPFLNSAWTSGSSWFMYCWNLTWRILSITLPACEMSALSDIWFANICKNQLCGLSFYSLDGTLWCTKVFHFDVVQYVCFFFHCLCFLVPELRNYCLTQRYKDLPFLSSKSFIVFVVIYMSLIHSELIFVYGVR